MWADGGEAEQTRVGVLHDIRRILRAAQLRRDEGPKLTVVLMEDS